MAKTIVDITETITGDHFRYKNFIREMEWTKDGITKTIPYMSIGHGFTHIDAPCHFIPGGEHLYEIDDLLDVLIGRASILDVSYVGPEEPITAEKLEKAYDGCETNKVLLVKTGWGKTVDSTTPEYWAKAPYITPDGAKYLASLNPRLVGYDFPQDYGIRTAATIPVMYPETSPTHFEILSKKILMIEYLNYLWKVPAGIKNVDFYALPLNLYLDKCDGTSIRVVVAYE